MNEINTNPEAATETKNRVMDDHELLSAYVQGDERAFEALVEKYFRMVFATAARQTGDFHLAEEVSQTVFLILSRKARGFSSRASVGGWLMQTTRFVCKDAIKMRRRRQQHEQELEATIEHSLETLAEPGMLEALLDEALLTLKADEHAGVFARFVEGKNFKEIAAMLAISEDTAQKRISRSLDKLRAFMVKRGAKVPLTSVAGLLSGRAAHEATNQALSSAIHTTLAFLKAKPGVGNVAALANRATRLLMWRTAAGIALKFAVPVLLVVFGVSVVHALNPTVDRRVEKLGRAWGAVDRRVGDFKQMLARVPINDPAMQRQVDAVGRDYSRIMADLNPLLVPPNERTRLAIFFSAELDEAVKLDTSEKTNLISILQSRLAQGATLKDTLKSFAATIPAQTTQIKAMLSPKQQQLFDQTYGADGLNLFCYAKVATLDQMQTTIH
jgi:RNA polymerase sigma factor (sigma-70 family)